MNATPVAHPGPELLQAFALGKLGTKAGDEVAAHVARCPSCSVALRQAAPGPSRPVPVELANHPRYRILAHLGAGGMGTVYKAQHRIMERAVALKVITPHLVSHPQAIERFRQEARAAARLSHPNIVAAHDADQAGGLHFLVMEFVEGSNLGSLVERKGPLAFAHACSFARQCALGLQHAHDHGMIHRDIKPHNLMVTKQGVVKVLDFGLARFATTASAGGETNAKPLTAVDAVLGTPDFLSPEQAYSSRDIDARADLYSLGCTLYYLLTGYVPFPGLSTLEKLLAHCERQPTPIAELRPDVPPALAGLVSKLMEKKPEDRFQTAAEVAAALGPFARQGPVTLPVEPALPVATFVAGLPSGPGTQAIPSTQQVLAGAHEDTLSTRLRRGPESLDETAQKARKKRFAAWVVGAVALAALAAFIIHRTTRPGEDTLTKVGRERRVLFVLPPYAVSYPEYAQVRSALESQGVEVVVASSANYPIKPEDEKSPLVKPNVLLANVKNTLERYDAVLFCGGVGVLQKYTTTWKNDDGVHAAAVATDLVKATLAANKPLGAIGAGTAVLAEANEVRGRKVARNERTTRYLNERGATVIDQPVVEDGLLITAQGPFAAEEFARAIVRAVGQR